MQYGFVLFVQIFIPFASTDAKVTWLYTQAYKWFYIHNQQHCLNNLCIYAEKIADICIKMHTFHSHINECTFKYSIQLNMYNLLNAFVLINLSLRCFKMLYSYWFLICNFGIKSTNQNSEINLNMQSAKVFFLCFYMELNCFFIKIF